MPKSHSIADFEGKEEKWNQFMQISDDVLKALEEARDEKVIGKSLEAKVTIVPNNDTITDVLTTIANLHQLLIVSEAIISYDEAKASTYKYVSVLGDSNPAEKCERCWMASNTVGDNKEHPTLCVRCADVVDEHYI